MNQMYLSLSLSYVYLSVCLCIVYGNLLLVVVRIIHLSHPSLANNLMSLTYSQLVLGWKSNMVSVLGLGNLYSKLVLGWKSNMLSELDLGWQHPTCYRAAQEDAIGLHMRWVLEIIPDCSLKPPKLVIIMERSYNQLVLGWKYNLLSKLGFGWQHPMCYRATQEVAIGLHMRHVRNYSTLLLSHPSWSI